MVTSIATFTAMLLIGCSTKYIPKTTAYQALPHHPSKWNLQTEKGMTMKMSVNSESNDRRKALSSIGRGLFFSSAAIAGSWRNQAASASTAVAPVPLEQVASLLRSVPTFTIVDAKGVPYMVFGEDAKLTAYFFTTYGEAESILKLARESADKAVATAIADLQRKNKKEGLSVSRKELEEEVGGNPWGEARISTVPLEFAVTLVTQSGKGGVYFKIAPAEKDVEDALGLDPSHPTELAEGKVPLFYIQDFQNQSGNEPLYFRRSELIKEYRKSYPDKEVPRVKVTELLDVLQHMVQPDDTDDDDLNKLVFVAPKESQTKAKECTKKGKKESPFVLGERIVIL